MELIGIYLLLCLPVGLLAQFYGRSAGGWFLLSIILSPLLVGIALLIAGRAQDRDRRRCPVCAEDIRLEAVKCRYCGADVAQNQAAPETAGEWLRRHRTDPPTP